MSPNVSLNPKNHARAHTSLPLIGGDVSPVAGDSRKGKNMEVKERQKQHARAPRPAPDMRGAGLTINRTRFYFWACTSKRVDSRKPESEFGFLPVPLEHSKRFRGSQLSKKPYTGELRRDVKI